MDVTTTHIAIIAYPNSMTSCINGLRDIFYFANTLAQNKNINHKFITEAIPYSNLDCPTPNIIIIPPALKPNYYLSPDRNLCEWIEKMHMNGATACAVCRGVFILAASGILKNREITTNWKFVKVFTERHSGIIVRPEKLLIDDEDIITTSGVMSWIDLGLNLVEKKLGTAVMQELAKFLTVDISTKEQRPYQKFSPSINHHDPVILTIQNHIFSNYQSIGKISNLAELAKLSERTFHRRFFRATGINPKEYLQKLRVQKACDLMQRSDLSIEQLASAVGYQNSASFRRVFTKTMGQTPSSFAKQAQRQAQERYDEAC